MRRFIAPLETLNDAYWLFKHLKCKALYEMQNLIYYIYSYLFIITSLATNIYLIKNLVVFNIFYHHSFASQEQTPNTPMRTSLASINSYPSASTTFTSPCWRCWNRANLAKLNYSLAATTRKETLPWRSSVSSHLWHCGGVFNCVHLFLEVLLV